MSGRIFIIDTNVLVAGLITAESNSPTSRVLDAMLSGSLFYLLSAELLREYRNVLLRPRLSRLHGLNELEIEQLLTEITANAIWREPPPDTNHKSPGDRLLIEKPRPQSSVISPATWAEHFYD